MIQMGFCMYLLDTNVLSEIRKVKQNKANKNVVQWLKTVTGRELCTSVVVLMEIKKGILRVSRKDEQQAKHLESWYFGIKQTFANRIFHIDDVTADICATLHTPNPAPANDAWIASTALQHDLTLVTRNVNDFDIKGLKLLNPFEPLG